MRFCTLSVDQGRRHLIVRNARPPSSSRRRRPRAIKTTRPATASSSTNRWAAAASFQRHVPGSHHRPQVLVRATMRRLPSRLLVRREAPTALTISSPLGRSVAKSTSTLPRHLADQNDPAACRHRARMSWNTAPPTVLDSDVDAAPGRRLATPLAKPSVATTTEWCAGLFERANLGRLTCVVATTVAPIACAIGTAWMAESRRRQRRARVRPVRTRPAVAHRIERGADRAAHDGAAPQSPRCPADARGRRR